MLLLHHFFIFFFFNDTATTEIYTLSLHDALPICGFAFLIGGSSTNGAIATSGRFTADGAGGITDVIADENNSGGITLLPQGQGAVTGSYAVDADGLGGGVLTWTDPSITGQFSFIFYLVSPTQAVFQETDSSIVSDGTLSAQTTSPITAASMAGDYAFSWSGVGTSGDEEDFAGQVTLTSSGNFTGLMDSNQFS